MFYREKPGDSAVHPGTGHRVRVGAQSGLDGAWPVGKGSPPGTKRTPAGVGILFSLKAEKKDPRQGETSSWPGRDTGGIRDAGPVGSMKTSLIKLTGGSPELARKIARA